MRRFAMKDPCLKPPAAVGLAVLLVLSLSSAGSLAQEPEVVPPDPGVPQIFTLKGQFVRIAYNNQGYVSLGYRVANQSVGEEWMLLEVGMTVREASQSYVMKRENISLETPGGGEWIKLATNPEFRQADLRALENRARIVRDSINYFPPMATQACPIRFFAELGAGPSAIAFDQVELSQQRACLGRLFFNIPGGIQYGQHYLNVSFASGMIRVPFYIMTKEEEKKFSKEWKDIKKKHEEAFKQK
jgi:hypothetical protein